eukprot:5671098-Ditylum_brightwellii.AAC.1
MQLFSSVDVDLNDVYYFCTSKANRKEALMWIDALPELLHKHFSFEDQCLIHNSADPNQGPMHVYRDEAAENTDKAIQGFASVIDEGMDTADDDANEVKVVEEDSLANCWTAPPHSVYSCFSNVTASSSSTTQGSTDNTVKDIEQKQEESELEVSKALDKFNEATNEATKASSFLFQSSLSEDIKKFFKQTSALDQKSTELEEWHTHSMLTRRKGSMSRTKIGKETGCSN